MSWNNDFDDFKKKKKKMMSKIFNLDIYTTSIVPKM